MARPFWMQPSSQLYTSTAYEYLILGWFRMHARGSDSSSCIPSQPWEARSWNEQPRSSCPGCRCPGHTYRPLVHVSARFSCLSTLFFAQHAYVKTVQSAFMRNCVLQHSTALYFSWSTVRTELHFFPESHATCNKCRTFRKQSMQPPTRERRSSLLYTVRKLGSQIIYWARALRRCRWVARLCSLRGMVSSALNSSFGIVFRNHAPKTVLHRPWRVGGTFPSKLCSSNSPSVATFTDAIQHPADVVFLQYTSGSTAIPKASAWYIHLIAILNGDPQSWCPFFDTRTHSFDGQQTHVFLWTAAWLCICTWFLRSSVYADVDVHHYKMTLKTTLTFLAQ